MADSVYRVTEVIGASTESWEAAASSAVETAAKTVRDLRVAEATQDVTIENGRLRTPRATRTSRSSTTRASSSRLAVLRGALRRGASASAAVGQVGVGALDEVGGAVVRLQGGEADLDLARIEVGRERDVDGAKTLAGILDRRT